MAEPENRRRLVSGGIAWGLGLARLCESCVLSQRVSDILEESSSAGSCYQADTKYLFLFPNFC